MGYNIILASGSPRRKELLENIGLEFNIVMSEIDEVLDGSKTPWGLVESLATAKAKDVSSRVFDCENKLIIAADTIVCLDNKVIGKPHDEQHACDILRNLSGKTHEVYTGYCVLLQGKVTSGYEKTLVKFRNLSDDDILSYVKTGEPLDKAGAYGIQGRGGLFVEHILGDYFNVVGLPLSKMSAQIGRDFGISLFK